MKLEKLLEVIQVQRHDFLNHIQVISGYLQLNKVDYVREYIRQICLEATQMSKTARIKIPEVTAVLLIGFKDAAKYQITASLAVDSNLTDCAVPGHVLGEALECNFDSVIASMASPELEERRLEVYFTERERTYICRLCFPAPQKNELRCLESRIACASGLLNPHGGKIRVTVNDSDMKIYICLPKKGNTMVPA